MSDILRLPHTWRRYNTFMQTNISQQAGPRLPRVFKILGQPVRLQILLILNTGEECVCHIEAILGIRQASISQQLMVLRDAGLVLRQS